MGATAAVAETKEDTMTLGIEMDKEDTTKGERERERERKIRN